MKSINPPVKILLASGNPHKLREMRSLLMDGGVGLLGAGEVGGLPAVQEDGATFIENAVKKAVEVSRCCMEYPVLADDSGFAVAALGGAPGVYSARYAGENVSDAENVEKLMVALAGKEDRRAAFHCVLAVAWQGRLLGTVAGRVDGRVVDAPRGSGGFGYDPVFVAEGFDKTFAEMAPETKNQISHRAQAMQALLNSGLLEEAAAWSRKKS